MGRLNTGKPKPGTAQGSREGVAGHRRGHACHGNAITAIEHPVISVSNCFHPRVSRNASWLGIRDATTYNGGVFAFTTKSTEPMLTDAPPRKLYLADFRESDRIGTLDLPQDARLPDIVKTIEPAMKSDQMSAVRGACAEFLQSASLFYQVPDCTIRVLAAIPLRIREQWTTELFGDYDPEAMLIRVWMRTAVRKDVTSFGTFLSTLCHEFCHHLDYRMFGFPDSWHTRGFYERTAELYHHARGTPRKKLYWAPMSSGRWRIDWQKTNQSTP